MDQKQIDKILKDNKDMFDALEEYDRTGKLPKLKSSKLKALRAKTGKPISRIIEEKII